MSKSFKLKNNSYLDSTSVAFDKNILYDTLINQPKCLNIYVGDLTHQYLIINIPSTNSDMIDVKIIGNGYEANPIDSVIQGYHYLNNNTHALLQCKIHNNSCDLSAWFIWNNTIKLVVQIPSRWTSYNIMLWTPRHPEIAHKATITSSASMPTGTLTQQCINV